MRPLSSLRNRIFLASALVAVLCVAFAIQVVTAREAREAEAELRRGLDRSVRLVERQQAARTREARVAARLVADLPRLKAAVETGDAPTVRPVAADYHARVGADVFIVTGPDGVPLAALGTPLLAVPRGVETARQGHEATTFQLAEGGIVQLVSVPIHIGPPPAEVLGTLTLGFALDDALAAEFEALTESEVAFALGGTVSAATLPPAARAALGPAFARTDAHVLSAGGTDYVARIVQLGDAPGGPQALVLRSRSERLAALTAFRTGLLAAALVAVLLGVLLSFAVAKTVTRPLALLTAAMRELADTGDLDRRIHLPGRWNDEDATLVARSFNGLLSALARFQREAALRQRLTALGRLSSVIAHEVRNPLMVIKSTLPALRRPGAPAEELREAADDIDREIARLDRIVGDVLDTTRAVRLDAAPADLGRLCREAAEAACAGEPDVDVALDVAAGLPPLVTDGERLRRALVALLANAREAVLFARAASGAAPAPGDVRLRAAPAGDGRVVIEIDDRGPGIAAHDLPHVFEPYFTTKRTGTGLGLAIARHVVEALGGALSAHTRDEGGARLRIELPVTPPPTAAAPPAGDLPR